MYQFSRAIYREIAHEIDPDQGRDTHEAVLRACERCIERLVTDRHYFARPARTLFTDIRMHFPCARSRACGVSSRPTSRRRTSGSPASLATATTPTATRCS